MCSAVHVGMMNMHLRGQVEEAAARLEAEKMKLTMCQDRLQSADQARQVEIRVYQTSHCCLGSVLVSVWMCSLTGHQLSDPRGACASPRGTLQREPPSLASPGPPNRHLYFPQPLTRVLQVVTVEETGHVLRRAQGAEQQAQQSLKQRAVAMFLAGEVVALL